MKKKSSDDAGLLVQNYQIDTVDYEGLGGFFIITMSSKLPNDNY